MHRPALQMCDEEHILINCYNINFLQVFYVDRLLRLFQNLAVEFKLQLPGPR